MPRLADDPLGLPLLAVGNRSQRENITGSWRSLRPVIRLDACNRCMICWKFCPEACVEISGGAPVILYDYCKGCGICVAECPPKCIDFPAEREEACAKS